MCTYRWWLGRYKYINSIYLKPLYKEWVIIFVVLSTQYVILATGNLCLGKIQLFYLYIPLPKISVILFRDCILWNHAQTYLNQYVAFNFHSIVFVTHYVFDFPSQLKWLPPKRSIFTVRLTFFSAARYAQLNGVTL